MLHFQGCTQECCVTAVLSQASNLVVTQVQHSCRHRHAVPVMSNALPGVGLLCSLSGPAYTDSCLRVLAKEMHSVA